MKTLRLICCLVFFAWVVAPLVLIAAICCNEAEQTEIGDALFLIVRAIGGRNRLYP